MLKPLISIIIPTYNRAHLIVETLESVLSQTYTNWECIVVDDGSIDNTAEIINKYCEKDTRFQFFKRPKDRLKGANACRNYGFEKSKGAYINWFDSDDLWVNNMLAVHLEHICTSKKMVSITQAMKFQNNRISDIVGLWNLMLLDERSIDNMIRTKFSWSITSALWSKEVVPDKPFEESLQAAQEWLFHIKQAHRLGFNSFVFSQDVTSYIRITKSASIGNTNTLGIRNPNYLRARNHLILYFKSVNENKYLHFIFRYSSSLVTKILKYDHRNVDLLDFELNLEEQNYMKWLNYKIIKMVIVVFRINMKLSKRMMLRILK